MCQQCLEAVKREYPALDTKEILELLWEATCYPFGTLEKIEEQLRYLKQNTATMETNDSTPARWPGNRDVT